MPRHNHQRRTARRRIRHKLAPRNLFFLAHPRLPCSRSVLLIRVPLAIVNFFQWDL
jgi:hypothetical protein